MWFFEFYSVGHPCPMNYNPANHFILTLAIIPGFESECKGRVEVSFFVCVIAQNQYLKSKVVFKKTIGSYVYYTTSRVNYMFEI